MEYIDNSKGFVVLPRTFLDSWVWKNQTYTQLWIEMVCKASWRDYTETINGNQVLIKRGEFIMSLYALCKKYDLDKRYVKRFLKQLETKNWIKIEKNNNIIIYYIVDIDYYQPSAEKINLQQDSLSVLEGVNSVYPQCHLQAYPNAYPKVYPLEANKRNAVNDDMSDSSDDFNIAQEGMFCTHNCTQNDTHHESKSVPTYNRINNNNNIFNNNNNNNTIGRVCERARGVDFAESDEGMSGFIKEHSDINLLCLVKQDSRWIKSIQSIFNLKTVEEVEKSLKFFWYELIAKGIDCHESLTDFKSHYYGWMRIQQGLEEKKKNSNEQNNRYYNDYSKRRPAPISTKFPKEEDFRF